MKILNILIPVLLIPSLISAGTGSDDIWKPLRYFEGSWIGHETGRSGVGRGDRTYQFIMDETYLYFENTSHFEPQEKNPEGEVHQDWTFYSYDKDRGRFVMRQFNIEGFVNRFSLDSLSTDGKFMRFELEAAENAPEDLRARMTYIIKSEDQFEEVFELAFPGQEYSVWLRNYWKRK